MLREGKRLTQGHPASKQQHRGQNPALPDAKALSSLSVPTWLHLPFRRPHTEEPAPTLGTSPLTPDKASCSLGASDWGAGSMSVGSYFLPGWALPAEPDVGQL